MDAKAAESRYQLESVDDSGLIAEQSFDARWAVELLNELMKRLEESYADDGSFEKSAETAIRFEAKLD